jgi:hypothetical protein
MSLWAPLIGDWLARITALQSRLENCPNALGTAELLRIALTSKQKTYTYVSTIGVGDQIEPSKFVEEADIRVINPTRRGRNASPGSAGCSTLATGRADRFRGCRVRHRALGEHG